MRATVCKIMQKAFSRAGVRSTKKQHIAFFERIWSKNKAMGLAAQASFEEEMNSGLFKKHSEKLFHGCWLVSPKSLDSHKFRFCIFVHDKLIKTTKNELDVKTVLGDGVRQFYAIAEYMDNAGVSAIYAIPSTESDDFDFESMLKDYSMLKWDLYFYENEKFVKTVLNSLNTGRETGVTQAIEKTDGMMKISKRLS